MKIAVYAIALNEARFAKRFVASAREADHILVADTGSTDDTVQRLKALGADVRKLRVAPWRFDAARNGALALLPKDIDACISLDLDQTLAPGWRPLVEQAWTAGANQLFYTLVDTQPGETGAVVFQDNRIHARIGFVWRYPCHECLAAEPGTQAKVLVQPQLKILHAPDPEKSRASYLPLLELAVAENPSDARSAHYLAREYAALGRHPEAAAQCERYLALTSGHPALERNATLRILAHSREALGDVDGALALFQAAAAEAPKRSGPWVALAWAHHRRQDWQGCLAAAERAIARRDEIERYSDNTSPGVVVEDLACLASWALGRPLTALDYARNAVAKAPKNPRLKANLARIEAALASKKPQAFGVSMTPLAGVDSAPPQRTAHPARHVARRR